MAKMRSDFLRDIGGCPAAMWHGWMRQAVKADFREGTGGQHDPGYSKPNVMIVYGGGETNLCNLHHRQLAEHTAAHFWKQHGIVAAVEPVAAVTDAISMGHSYEHEPRLSAMGYSLFSREIFASSIVQQVEINCVDSSSRRCHSLCEWPTGRPFQRTSHSTGRDCWSSSNSSIMFL